MKVLTFSLWGNQDRYNIGAIKNAELAAHFYPDFECWFYIHEETVPKKTIDELQKMQNVKIILKNGDLNVVKPMMWRFEAIDDPNVEIMMSRDTDTRILLREKLATDEWLNSGKLFHIMRDHPHHYNVILGGMFGTKKIPEINNWKTEMDKIIQKSSRDYDQNFLKDIVYPLIKNNSIIHSSFFRIEPHCKFFPIKYDGELHFVGEYVYENGSRSSSHTNHLRDSINLLSNKGNLI